MSPIYSDDQPDKSEKHPIDPDGVHRFAIPQEILYRMRRQNALPIRENDYLRFVRTARELEGRSSNWVAAAWALVGIAASLAGIALTVSGQLLMFGGFAMLCGLGAYGCFIADRQVNQKQEDAAETLALEMEEAADTDRIEIVPLGPGEEGTPPSGPSP